MAETRMSLTSMKNGQVEYLFYASMVFSTVVWLSAALFSTAPTVILAAVKTKTRAVLPRFLNSDLIRLCYCPLSSLCV
jgi:hypothetical protein